jgi:hypothetical protein
MEAEAALSADSAADAEVASAPVATSADVEGASDAAADDYDPFFNVDADPGTPEVASAALEATVSDIVEVPVLAGTSDDEVLEAGAADGDDTSPDGKSEA